MYRDTDQIVLKIELNFLMKQDLKWFYESPISDLILLLSLLILWFFRLIFSLNSIKFYFILPFSFDIIFECLLKWCAVLICFGFRFFLQLYAKCAWWWKLRWSWWYHVDFQIQVWVWCMMMVNDNINNYKHEFFTFHVLHAAHFCLHLPTRLLIVEIPIYTYYKMTCSFLFLIKIKNEFKKF